MKIYKKGLKIVMTDDDEDDRIFFKDAIESLELDCVLEFYKNGMELIERLDDSDKELPDLVFLDLNMPLLSGIDTLQKIRMEDKLNRIPIIAIYSTSSDYNDKKRSLEIGANAYITKPSSFESLKSLLEIVIMKDWENRETILMENFVIKGSL